MIFNVSHLKLSFECPQKAWNRYIHLRGEPIPSTALSVGTLVHLYFAARLDPSATRSATANEAVASADEATLREFSALTPALLTWRKPDDWRVEYVERELRLPLPGGHELVGTLDALVHWNGKYWHLQHKTLRPSVPIHVYQEQQRSDWHECAYEAMAIAAGFAPYGGTILNLVRKLSAKTIMAAPQTALNISYLTRSPDIVTYAIRDMDLLANDIASAVGLSNAHPVRNRSACAGAFGNKLCPYIRVCNGEATLDDDCFVTIEPRYSPAPEEPA